MTEKKDTKNKILDAAQQLMLSESFHGVSVDRLIAEAGISKGSFFYHFNSKDDLPVALLERFLAHQGARLQDAFSTAKQRPDLSALQRVFWVIDETTKVFCETYDGQPGCVMAAFSYQLMRDFPVLREVSNRALCGWRAGFAPLFGELLGCGREAEAEELAMLFMCILQGGNVVARIENRPQAIQVAVKHFKLHLQMSSSTDQPTGNPSEQRPQQ